ncbi:MAG: hypothetical protein ACOC6J_11520 [Spirochaetota bacterium]
MKETDVSRAVRSLRDEADAATRRMPPPDVDALVERAELQSARGSDARGAAGIGPGDGPDPPSPPGIGSGFGRSRVPVLPALAAAAALGVIVLGLRLTGTSGEPLVGAPVAAEVAPSEQLLSFVDSLYDDGSYVIDEIAPRWASPGPAGSAVADGYLSGVWADVVHELTLPDD